MELGELLNILLEGLQDQKWTLESDVTLIVEDNTKDIIIGELTSISINEAVYFDADGMEHSRPDGVSLYAEYDR